MKRYLYSIVIGFAPIGDLLFRSSVGNIDYIFESKDDIVKSIRRLYGTFPDETIVYPGHGKSTDIGTE